MAIQIYTPRTRPSSLGLSYLQPAVPNINIGRSLMQLGGALQGRMDRDAAEREKQEAIEGFNRKQEMKEIERLQEEALRKQRKDEEFNTLAEFAKFETSNNESAKTYRTGAKPGDTTWMTQYEDDFDKKAEEWLGKQPEHMQSQMRYRMAILKEQTRLNNSTFHTDNTTAGQLAELESFANNAATSLGAAPNMDNLKLWQDRADEMIDASTLPVGDKQARKRSIRRVLQGIVYKQRWKDGDTWSLRASRQGEKLPVDPGSRADLIAKSAERLGINPEHWAAAISYETGGTFSTSKWGGKGGAYLGLIQFGPWEQQHYGVTPGDSFEKQLAAAEQFMKDRGLKPGMGMLDIYSTINAGRPGLYHRSDRPGMTVASHVAEILGGDHMAKAKALLSGAINPDGIDQDMNFADIPYEDRLLLRRDGEREKAEAEVSQARQLEAARKAQVNDLQVKLQDGTGGMTDIENARESGILYDADEIAKMTKIVEDREASVADANLVSNMMMNGQTFNSSDPRQTKGLNDLFNMAKGAEQLNAMNEDFAANTLIPMAERTGDLPTDATGTLRGMTRSKDDRQAAYALDVMAQLQDRAPAAFEQRFNEDEVAMVERWRALKDVRTVGQPGEPKDQMTRVLNQVRGGVTAQERADRNLLRDEADKILTAGDLPSGYDLNNLHNQFFSSLGAQFPTLTGTQAVVPNVSVYARQGLRRDWTVYFKEFYADTADKDKAAELATKMLKINWGVTNIGGGGPYLTKWSPEMAGYPKTGPNNDHAWIEEQVREQFKLDPEDTFQLVADETTPGEVRNYRLDPRNPPPAYRIVITDKDGVIRMATNPNGDQQVRARFRLSPDEIKREDFRFRLKNEEEAYRKWLENTIGPSREHGEGAMIIVPPDLLDEQKEYEQRIDAYKKDVEMMDNIIKAPKKVEERGPHAN